MRVLTVRQPWAWAIIHGGKDVENRMRNVAGSYRGPVAIHAALADAENAPAELWLKHARHYKAELGIIYQALGMPLPTRRGEIIGVVDLVDVHDPRDGLFNRSAWPGTFDACSPWAEPNTFHLVLANPRPLVDPIPYRGALGLRELDPATTTRVVEALAA